MIGLRVNTKKVLPLILSSCISSKESQLFLNQRTTGMAESQLNFENKALLQTPIKHPNIKEQIAIVTILDDLDGEIKKITQKRKKINLLKHSIMQYFFKKN
jgi:type I restriction enzyme S subunit